MKIHFLGIGGSGASAVANIALYQGFEITGCDLEVENEFIKDFDKDILFKGHSASHLYLNSAGVHTNHFGGVHSKVDLLVITPAILSLDPDNPELLEAKKLGIPILTWQQFMGEYLEKGKFVIAVCGTHGKSTVTAMSAKLLEDANLDPTVELGAIVPNWGKNYRVGKSKYFLTEADEFNNNFLPSKPDFTIVTNIEMDHPEFFKDLDAVKASFKKFMLQTKKIIIANISDINVAEVVKDVMKNSSVTVIDYSKHSLSLNLKIPGAHNILNAKAVFQLGLSLGLDTSIINQSISSYSGISRRFEYLGEFKGAKIYSDFGHHPTEIKTTIQAAREKFKKQRLVLVYEPHMFTRTKALFEDFVKVFSEIDTDQTFILDIYPSREIDTGSVSSKELVEAVAKNTVSYLGPKKDVGGFLKLAIREGDVVIFMGAGDVDKIAREVASNEKS